VQKKILIYFGTVLFWFIMLYFTNKIIQICDNKRKQTFDITYSKYIIGIYVLFFILLGITIAIIDLISRNNSRKENICQVIILGLAGLYLSMSQIITFSFTSISRIYPSWIILYSYLPMCLGSIVFGWEMVSLIKGLVVNKRK
jgi:uncharacterized membrane protein